MDLEKRMYGQDRMSGFILPLIPSFIRGHLRNEGYFTNHSTELLQLTVINNVIRICYYLITGTNLSYGYRARSFLTILDWN
jgi:hypothetical protein